MKIYKATKKDNKPDSFNIYKSVRKQMPKPGFVMDDGLSPHHKLKDIGGYGEEEMVTLDDLKNEASIACELKGHTLGKWNDSGNISTNHCLACDKPIVVNTRPKPNEIDIDGEAIISDCN